MLGNQILPYSFKDMEIRTIKGDNGKPLFNAKDVCDCLAISNSRDAIKRLDDEDLVSVKATSGGQKREMNFVTESGLYHLIFSSYKEEAKEFKRWVTNEVLPSIRKTGMYIDMRRLEELVGSATSKALNDLSLSGNKRRVGTPLNEREKEHIVTLYKELYSINAISREIGCDKGAVSRFLKKYRKEKGVA